MSDPDTRARKRAAFEHMVATYEAPLLRYAARLLRDPDAAQDAVQNAFLRLYRNWPGAWEPGPAVSSWLYRVTHNAAVDYLRRESRLQTLHQREAEEQPQELPPGQELRQPQPFRSNRRRRQEAAAFHERGDGPDYRPRETRGVDLRRGLLPVAVSTTAAEN